MLQSGFNQRLFGFYHGKFIQPDAESLFGEPNIFKRQAVFDFTFDKRAFFIDVNKNVDVFVLQNRKQPFHLFEIFMNQQ